MFLKKIKKIILNKIKLVKDGQSFIDIKDLGNFVFVRPPEQIVGRSNCVNIEDEYLLQGVFVQGRKVKLKPYYIGKYEVTYQLWQEVYDWAISNGYNLQGGQNGSSEIYESNSNPVTKVSWLDCIVWCNAYTHKEKSLNDCVYRNIQGKVIKNVDNLKPSEVIYDQTKQGYRLPTEVEWEFAARFQGQASRNALDYGGFYLTNLDSLSGARDNYQNMRENERVAWFRGNSFLGVMDKNFFQEVNCFDNNNLIGREEFGLFLSHISFGRAHPVGQKAANYAGLYDMSGNVMEWCYDGYEESLATGTIYNPCGDNSNCRRVVRSGVWDCLPKVCVIGFRRCWKANDHCSSIGFRLACSGAVGWEDCRGLPFISVEQYNYLAQRLNHQLLRRQYLSNDPIQVAKLNGHLVNLLSYWKFLEALEKLVDISEAAQEVYNSPEGKLPKSYFDLRDNIDIAKIENILNVAEKEYLYGFIINQGDFVLFRPQSKIIGVDSQIGYKRNTYDEGVFILGRTVELSPYCIGKYTVTYKLWMEVYNWNQRNNKGYILHPGEKGSHSDHRNTVYDPVTNINWFDCIVWCNAYTEMIQGSTQECVYMSIDKTVIKSIKNLNPSRVYYDQTKKGYRLPTEAEWEYAARFQANNNINALKYRYDYLTRLDSLSGARENRIDEIDKVAVYRKHCHSGKESGQTFPVGQKFANYAGLYDMSGNVWEWCYDGWQDLLPLGTVQNPCGLVSAKERVIRGGCWRDSYKDCVLGLRSYREAIMLSGCDYGLYDTGFRLAYSCPTI